MDMQLINGLFNPESCQQHSQALQCLQQVKESKDAWNVSSTTLALGGMNLDDKAKFLCLQILEFYAKSGYETATPEEQKILRQHLSQWMQAVCNANPSEKIFVRNKTAQVFSLIFVTDYIERWPTFFSDILSTLALGPNAVDIYLKILLAIDRELVDRENTHSPEKMRRSTFIKDTMREHCVNDLANSWYDIMVKYEKSHPELVCHCHDIIGAFVSWIDIGLIANDRFISLLVKHLHDPLLREAAADCIHDIFLKGMEPLSKLQLVELLHSVLEANDLLKPVEDEDSDFMVKLSRLFNCMGCQLILAWHKLPTGDLQNKEIIRQAVENKVTLLMQFMACDYDDVSTAIFDFARDYIQLIKQSGHLTDVERGQMENMLWVIITKTKYDESYDFESEGEDEAIFDEYRKKIKNVFDNLASLVPEIILKVCKDYVVMNLNRWQSTPFEDVEAAISLLYSIGEALPATQGNHFSGSAQKSCVISDLMKLLVSSGVYRHSHPAVSLQFFETVTRYEKFFCLEISYIPVVLQAFLDECGLRNKSPKVRSRTSYLFSRFVRCLKANIIQYSDFILEQIANLINSCEESTCTLLSNDDQLYVYEAAAMLIISGNSEPMKKEEQLKVLLSPTLNKVANISQNFPTDADNPIKQLSMATSILHATAIMARASKAFSAQNSMKSCNCIQLYLGALQLFINCLNICKERDIIISGVRQLMHRIVVCIEAQDILPILPAASQALLQTPTPSAISEYMPLINQIITKFKKDVMSFVKELFTPLVSSIFATISSKLDESEYEEKRIRRTLQRNYFTFLATIISANLQDVIIAQEPAITQQVLVSIVESAVEFNDPLAQKNCFIIMKKMIETWGANSQPPHFVEFIYSHIIPACFMAPMKDTFDLNDALTIQALQEAAMCLRMVYDKRGQEAITVLSDYLRKMSVNDDVINQFCHTLAADSKTFRNYCKIFFMQVKS